MNLLIRKRKDLKNTVKKQEPQKFSKFLFRTSYDTLKEGLINLIQFTYSSYNSIKNYILDLLTSITNRLESGLLEVSDLEKEQFYGHPLSDNLNISDYIKGLKKEIKKKKSLAVVKRKKKTQTSPTFSFKIDRLTYAYFLVLLHTIISFFKELKGYFRGPKKGEPKKLDTNKTTIDLRKSLLYVSLKVSFLVLIALIFMYSDFNPLRNRKNIDLVKKELGAAEFQKESSSFKLYTKIKDLDYDKDKTNTKSFDLQESTLLDLIYKYQTTSDYKGKEKEYKKLYHTLYSSNKSEKLKSKLKDLLKEKVNYLYELYSLTYFRSLEKNKDIQMKLKENVQKKNYIDRKEIFGLKTYILITYYLQKYFDIKPYKAISNPEEIKKNLALESKPDYHTKNLFSKNYFFSKRLLSLDEAINEYANAKEIEHSEILDARKMGNILKQSSAEDL